MFWARPSNAVGEKPACVDACPLDWFQKKYGGVNKAEGFAADGAKPSIIFKLQY